MDQGGRSGRAGTEAFVYSPEFVARWLRDWDLLVSLAESPRTSVHHLRLGHADHDGPCSLGPRIRGGRAADGLDWALVKADLEGAAARLTPGSLERRVALARMGGGGTLSEISVILRTRKAVVLEAYRAAVGGMAALLGWVPDER